MLDDFKPALKILGRFIGIYLVLFLVYQWYLNPYVGVDLDPISKWIANQVVTIQNALGYDSKMVDYPKYETSSFYINGIYPSRMVEGCNAISIMILFVAFIFAFYRGKKTIAYALAGVVFLHVLNVLRIVGLNILKLEYPQYGKVGHDYVFPAIIYGAVVVLWLIWINKFALKK